MRELLAFGLTEEGYAVHCAVDGESAWQSLSTAPFDLLITDHEMPGLTGIDLLRRMRAFSFCVPAILMSGNLPRISPEVKELLSPGAAMAKPFKLPDLNTLIEALLRYRRAGLARQRPSSQISV